MHCPMCDALVLEVLINDECACDDCGHRWLPEEARAHHEALLDAEVLPHDGALRPDGALSHDAAA